MSKKILIFSNNGINKDTFHKRKHDSINVKRIVISDKNSFGNECSFKYFIGYKSNEDSRPLCINLPQLSRYVKYFNDNNKCMNFLVHNNKILKAYNAI